MTVALSLLNRKLKRYKHRSGLLFNKAYVIDRNKETSLCPKPPPLPI